MNLKIFTLLLITIIFIDCGDTMNPPNQKSSKQNKEQLDHVADSLRKKQDFENVNLQIQNEFLRKYNSNLESNNPFNLFMKSNEIKFFSDLNNLYNLKLQKKDKDDLNSEKTKDQNLESLEDVENSLSQKQESKQFYKANQLFDMIISPKNETTLKIFLKDKELYKKIMENDLVFKFYVKYKDLFEAHYQRSIVQGKNYDFRRLPPYFKFRKWFLNKKDDELEKLLDQFESQFDKDRYDNQDINKKLDTASQIALSIEKTIEGDVEAKKIENLNELFLKKLGEILSKKENHPHLLNLFLTNEIKLSIFKNDEPIIRTIFKQMGIDLKDILKFDDLIQGLENAFGKLSSYNGDPKKFNVNPEISKSYVEENKNKYYWKDKKVKSKYTANTKSLPEQAGGNNKLVAEFFEFVKEKVIPTQDGSLKEIFKPDIPNSLKINNKGCGIITFLTALIYKLNLNGDNIKSEDQWRFFGDQLILNILKDYLNSSISPGKLEELLIASLKDQYKQIGQLKGSKIMEFFNPIISFIFNEVALLPSDFEERYEGIQVIGFTDKDELKTKLEELDNKLIMIFNTSGKNLHWHIGFYDKNTKKISIIETGSDEPQIFEIDKYINNRMEIRFDKTVNEKIKEYEKTVNFIFDVKNLKSNIKLFVQQHMIGKNQTEIEAKDVRYSILIFN
ncbi:MAG: hypothetical protein GY830_01930 [Bacteroidetes bacterium]|nr:hypothetical protein [Bacteroidota bacterium]